jgi:site-specific DNA recombinase
MTKAAIYVRVSTDDQADKGYSLPSQVDECRKYAELNGFTVVAELSDDYTGMKLNRPGLDQLRGLIDRREVDAVIVYSSDRLTRKLAHKLILREEWQRAGIELHFVRRGKSEDTPEGRLMDSIEGTFDEYWRDKIVEASRRGMHKKAKGNKVVGIGPAPYGYKYSEGSFIVIEEEAEVIRLIYALYTKGDGDGNPSTIYQITKKLSSLGILTPGERKHAARPRKRQSCAWSGEVISKILKNETYAGTWHFGKSLGACGRDGKRPIEKQIPVTVPAIITRVLWNATQERNKANKHLSKRNCKHNYLLRGMVFCGCGHAMVANTRVWGATYYRCTATVRYIPGVEPKSCSEKSARGEILDYLVWNDIYELMTDPAKFGQLLQESKRHQQDILKPKRDELETVNALIARKEEEALKCARALKDSPGGAVEQALRRDADRINQEFKGLNQRREELLGALDTQVLTDQDIEAAMEYRNDVIAGIENPTFEDKRRVLELLRVRVDIKDHIARVSINGDDQILGGSHHLCISTNYLRSRSSVHRLWESDATTRYGADAGLCCCPNSPRPSFDSWADRANLENATNHPRTTTPALDCPIGNHPCCSARNARCRNSPCPARSDRTTKIVRTNCADAIPGRVYASRRCTSARENLPNQTHARGLIRQDA